MKHSLFCIPALFLLASYQADPGDCRTVRRGVYEIRYKTPAGEPIASYRLVRGDSFQEESIWKQAIKQSSVFSGKHPARIC